MSAPVKDRKWPTAQRTEIEEITAQLLEANEALSVLARNIEKARKDEELRIYRQTRSMILPIIERLRRYSDRRAFHNELDLLAGHIVNLSPEIGDNVYADAELSPTEARIAMMIKNGLSTERIAKNLFISPNTVKTHRKNIRKKLKLQNSGTNLRAYLERNS